MAIVDPNDPIFFANPKTGEIVWQSHPGPQSRALRHRAFEVLFGGARGGGKLSPLESLVCTPRGFVQMGSLELGDTVSNPVTGGTSKIIGVFPQGLKPIWRLTFDDGASLEVGDEHLWAYRLANRKRLGSKYSSQREWCRDELAAAIPSSRWDRYKVGTTADVRKAFEEGRGVRIPLSAPVLFTANGRTGTGPVDPYTAGVMLGDGSCSQLCITACDDDIRNHLLSEGYTAGTAVHSDGKPKNYLAAGAARKHMDGWLRNHGLRHVRSWEKFIPEYVLTAPVEYRLAFLQGLMDTDGTIDERGRAYFISTSQRLAEGVQYLARSLGGKARLRLRQTRYTCQDVKLAGRPSFQIRIWHPKLSALFRVRRKKERATDSWNGGHEITRELVQVDYVGEKEARCISVSNPYGLYIADDFIVTHNSAALIAWLVLGNEDLPDDHPCRWSYLNHPKYAALILRRNATDLKDFLREASNFYRHFGAKKKDDPPEFHFPGGAVIYCNHLESEDAFDKYRGWNLTKVGIEELTQIEHENAYLKVLGSVRSPDPKVMRAQIFATTNPDGNGSGWVRNRFVHLIGKDGKVVPWGKTLLDPFSGRTRVFIQSKLKDNPSLGEEYLATLKMQDEKTRRAWIDGDWSALVGLYFNSFRPNGPVESSYPPEPAAARHVIPHGSVPLAGFWPRYIGCDWGYHDNAATVWLCDNQEDKRLHVYDELICDHVGSEQLGVLIAQRTLPDLVQQPDLQIPLFLSHDAFAVRDAGKTTAELIQRGLESVLGAGSVHAVLGATNSGLDTEDITADLFSPDSGASIVLHRAGRERVMVWQHIRSLLRFEPLLSLGEPNMEYARKLLEGPDGHIRYEAYLRAYAQFQEREANQVLPGILFHDNCVQLIEEMSTAVHDPKKPEDLLDARQGSSHMDALQALRHAVMYLIRKENRLPYRQFLAQRMQIVPDIYKLDPVMMAQIQRKANVDYRKATPVETGRLMRASSRRYVN